MSVVGVDLSTRALDLVKLADDTGRAEWVRVELDGADAWARTLGVRGLSRLRLGHEDSWETWWWDDVHLVAIEAPYGRGQAGTNALLNRVVGAVCASLPAKLRSPERCWLVPPHEWKKGLGLKGKPTYLDLVRLVGTSAPYRAASPREEDAQHGRDAFCLAVWASRELERGIAA